jgi:mannose-6-phosphate isomerase-like protein (cupin superfamily)
MQRSWLAPCVILASVLAAAQGGDAQQSAYGQWTSRDLQQRDRALSTKVGADHSARETLADYGDHRFRLLYRDADGAPEQHDAIVDVVIVQSGEGTLQLGGTMVGKRAGSAPGEYVGTRLDGGERHPLTAGDIVHIPATIPHSFLVPAGKHITYVLVKFPAR